VVTGWAELVEDYLRLRRSLGARLERPGAMLAGFARCQQDNRAPHLTIEAALAWALQPEDAEPVWYWTRLSAVRGLSAYLHAIDPRHQLVPGGLLRRDYHRKTPYLFTSADVDVLLRAAAGLRSPLYAATFHTLLALLSVTGMRPGEAIRLDREDVDLARAVITVTDTKRGKTRRLPLHPSTVTALREYAARRDQLCPLPLAPAFLLAGGGARLRRRNVQRTFTRLVRRHGIGQPRGAGMKNFRHALAVTTLIGWYRSDADVAARLPLLSAWLGHSDPAFTYWYLTASPELLAAVTERITRIARQQAPSQPEP
jgi:integrase/recombinase XerD